MYVVIERSYKSIKILDTTDGVVDDFNIFDLDNLVSSLDLDIVGYQMSDDSYSRIYGLSPDRYIIHFGNKLKSSQVLSISGVDIFGEYYFPDDIQSVKLNNFDDLVSNYLDNISPLAIFCIYLMKLTGDNSVHCYSTINDFRNNDFYNISASLLKVLQRLNFYILGDKLVIYDSVFSFILDTNLFANITSVSKFNSKSIMLDKHMVKSISGDITITGGSSHDLKDAYNYTIDCNCDQIVVRKEVKSVKLKPDAFVEDMIFYSYITFMNFRLLVAFKQFDKLYLSASAILDYVQDRESIGRHLLSYEVYFDITEDEFVSRLKSILDNGYFLPSSVLNSLILRTPCDLSYINRKLGVIDFVPYLPILSDTMLDKVAKTKESKDFIKFKVVSYLTKQKLSLGVGLDYLTTFEGAKHLPKLASKLTSDYYYKVFEDMFNYLISHRCTYEILNAEFGVVRFHGRFEDSMLVGVDFVPQDFDILSNIIKIISKVRGHRYFEFDLFTGEYYGDQLLGDYLISSLQGGV